MSTHFAFDDTTTYGRKLRRVMDAVETLIVEGPEVQACMQQMLTGDGTQDADYAEVAFRYKFVAFGVLLTGATDPATARSAWDELNAMLAKVTTDADVTSVHAALSQAIAKFR